VDEPRRRLDPLAVAVNAVAVVALVAVGGYLAVSLWRDKPAPLPKPAAKTAPKEAPFGGQVVPQPKPAPVPAQLLAQYGSGRRWHYKVSVEPALWRDATLVYRVADRNGVRSVDTDFTYRGGSMNFNLGVFAAGHPSHANVRFPGFFMHAAYLDRPLAIGQRFTWEWPWQLPGGQVRAGRIKRYDAVVKEWQTLPAYPSVKAPSDTFVVARIEATLSYLEGGEQRARAHEVLWYAPRYLQVVKVIREGHTPDEGAHLIIAELVRHDSP
jgi:hypothetical protein